MSTVIASNFKFSNGDNIDAGAVRLLATNTASSSATIEFDLTAGFFKYVIIMANIVPATDIASLYLRTSSDGGTTFDSGASDYRYFFSTLLDTANDSGLGDETAAEIQLRSIIGNLSTEGIDGEVSIINPSAASRTRVISQVFMITNIDELRGSVGAGERRSLADVDAIQFLFSSGNIASGIFTLYGWK